MSKENVINNDGGFHRFCHISTEDTLNKDAVHKKKHARDNQMPFFNKELSKAVTTRTKLQNRSKENRMRYTKQRNFWVSLLRKTKKDMKI